MEDLTMNTKKTLLAALAAFTALSLAGCGSSKKEEQETDSNETAAEPAADETAEDKEEGKEEETSKEETSLSTAPATDWTVNGSYSVMLGDEEKDLFKKAAEAGKLTVYEPVTVLADQVVSGMNYAYLCYKKDETPGAYAVVTVYKSASDETDIRNIAVLTPETLPVVNKQPAGLAGGWTVRGSGKPGAVTEEGEAALSAAAKSKSDLSLMPIVLLGEKEDEGYLFLCYGTASEDEKAVYAVKVRDNAITSCDVLDLGTLTQPQE